MVTIEWDPPYDGGLSLGYIVELSRDGGASLSANSRES